MDPELLFCDYVLLGGHFWPKFGDGALKYFDRDVPLNPVSQNGNSRSACFLDTLFMFIFVFGDAIWSFRGFAISFLRISSDNVVIGLTLSRPCCGESALSLVAAVGRTSVHENMDCTEMT